MKRVKSMPMMALSLTNTSNVSIKWNFCSGAPYSVFRGYYEGYDLLHNLSTNYNQQQGNTTLYYSNSASTGFLPYTHRLDFSYTKLFNISKRSKLEFNLSIINVYGRKNIFYIDKYTNERVNQLPFMQSVGINYKF